MGAFNITLLCALTLILTSGVCFAECMPKECPAFWSRFRQHCYRYFGRPQTWAEAEGICNMFSPSSHSNSTRVAHLVSLSNKDENDFVARFWDSSRSDGEDDVFLWLGLYKETDQDDFKWVDLGHAKYTNWDINRPNNYGGNENCAEMWKLHQASSPHIPMSWNDVLCKSKRPYICKMQVWEFKIYGGLTNKTGLGDAWEPRSKLSLCLSLSNVLTLIMDTWRDPSSEYEIDEI